MPSASKVIRAFMESYAELKPDEARMRLLDLRDTVGELEDENRALREEVRKLRESLRRRKDMEYHDCGFFILDGDAEVGPICPECYEAKGFAYVLRATRGGAACTVCGNEYAGTRGIDDGSGAVAVV